MQKAKYLELDVQAQNELDLNGMGKQQYRECSWINTNRVPSARSTIREWYLAYQSRGIHARTGRNWLRISSIVRNDSRISLPEFASEKGVDFAIVCNVLHRDLSIFLPTS